MRTQKTPKENVLWACYKKEVSIGFISRLIGFIQLAY